jgi:hypothetical protein
VMSYHEVTFPVPQDLFDQSVARLRTAGVGAPEELLETTLRASAIDALETVGGAGPVPTALSDVRAARLLQLCKLRNEILPDEVVAVLFRIMPTTAASITRRMQATYEAALQDSLKAHMIAMAKLSYPKKEKGDAPKHNVTFATAAAFAYAVKTIAAAGLTGEVSLNPLKRSIEFSQEVEVTRGGTKRKIRIAKDTLGVA